MSETLERPFFTMVLVDGGEKDRGAKPAKLKAHLISHLGKPINDGKCYVMRCIHSGATAQGTDVVLAALDPGSWRRRVQRGAGARALFISGYYFQVAWAGLAGGRYPRRGGLQYQHVRSGNYIFIYFSSFDVSLGPYRYSYIAHPRSSAGRCHSYKERGFVSRS